MKKKEKRKNRIESESDSFLRMHQGDAKAAMLQSNDSPMKLNKVDSEGNVVNVKVLKGVSEKTDEAALSIINDMKPWVAGSQRGKKASVIFNVPVKFK